MDLGGWVYNLDGEMTGMGLDRLQEGVYFGLERLKRYSEIPKNIPLSEAYLWK
jgi:hypothetical protein